MSDKIHKQAKTKTLYWPKSAESKLPMIVVDTRIRLKLLYFSNPFGLFIRLPFIWFRWGSA